MKKILLTLLAFAAFTGIYAQSLSLVVSDLDGKNIKEVKHNEEISIELEDMGGIYVADLYFKVKNNTDKSGSVKSQEMVFLNDAAKEYGDLNICDDVCISGGWGAFPAFNIAANETYAGVNKKAFHTQVITPVQASETARYRLDFKFSEDSEVSSFILNVNTVGSSSISSASNALSLNVYQNGTDAVVDYSFSEMADRYISVYNIAGEVVGKVKLEGESGSEVLPFTLNKGVYIYVLEENGTSLKAHKFIVK